MKDTLSSSSPSYTEGLSVDALAVAIFNSHTVYSRKPNYGWTDLSTSERAFYHDVARAVLQELHALRLPPPVADYFTPFVALTRARFGRKDQV